MSAGHSHGLGMEWGLNAAALDRILNNPQVKEALFNYRVPNRSFDLPYLGGYSEDGKTIYLDRHLPDEVTLELDGQKRTIRPETYLMRHETLEKVLIDTLGYGYYKAHRAATGYERRGVLMGVGPGWWPPYQKLMEQYVKADEHEKLVKVPKDLDMLPYRTPPVDETLLRRMKKAMH